MALLCSTIHELNLYIDDSVNALMSCCIVILIWSTGNVARDTYINPLHFIHVYLRTENIELYRSIIDPFIPKDLCMLASKYDIQANWEEIGTVHFIVHTQDSTKSVYNYSTTSSVNITYSMHF